MNKANELNEEYEKELYDYLVTYIEQHHYGPTIREIAANTSKSSFSTVKRYLDKLKQTGKIDYNCDESRTITLLTHDYFIRRKDDLRMERTTGMAAGM